MKVKIISDSTCDLSKELIEKYDIEILPLYVCLNDKTMKDGLEVNPDDIYSYVDQSGKLPNHRICVPVGKHMAPLHKTRLCSSRNPPSPAHHGCSAD